MTVGEEIATEHAAEAADTLRAAAEVGGPYLRGDVIWEAVERLRRAVLHLGHCRGRRSRFFVELVGALEDGCDGSAEPPAGAALMALAQGLDEQLKTLHGISP
jgi:hypothetical protein